MKYFTKEINGKEYQFRLTNDNICSMEERCKKSIQEIITDVSFNNLTMIMRNMRKGDTSDFRNAGEFIDYLVDEGYSLETIFTEIVYPACVESGIITKNDLNNVMEAITKQHEKKKEDLAKQ